MQRAACATAPIALSAPARSAAVLACVSKLVAAHAVVELPDELV
jgi:hypothetical protein